MRQSSQIGWARSNILAASNAIRLEWLKNEIDPDSPLLGALCCTPPMLYQMNDPTHQKLNYTTTYTKRNNPVFRHQTSEQDRIPFQAGCSGVQPMQ